MPETTFDFFATGVQDSDALGVPETRNQVTRWVARQMIPDKAASPREAMSGMNTYPGAGKGIEGESTNSAGSVPADGMPKAVFTGGGIG